MADTIRILVSTDNHVGYAERDPIRGDDSWKSFHEVMCLAKEQDVDMVLLGGDLFHENKPSRKAMYNVMRSLRVNCYGDKPCELELLSDGSEHFDSTIGHANYQDPDINVGIPVFSIHGNHDDPSGEGFYAALDILEMAGLINYFGRVPESDNITVKPLFFQKGRTKLALYGLSNVRDERLHRTFRDGKVKFMRPGTQQSDWFNLLCVHQNHHAHTSTSYLPEEQLPDWMDLVVWGHEHECDPNPHKNQDRGFRVLQPGSSVATSLVPGEAAPKQVFLLTVSGPRKFTLDPIRLKTVRPFVHKEITLSTEKEAVKIAKRESHRSELTRFLEKIVRGLIKEAREEWLESQGPEYDPDDPDAQPAPLPLIRLRVETTSPDGGATKFDVENPQRFSNRFINEVANRNDVVQFFARKKMSARNVGQDTKLDAEAMARIEQEEISAIKVQTIVKEFLAAQSLTILPQNYFGQAVSEYIDKDDKQAMEIFVNHSLANQIKNLVRMHEDNEDNSDEDDEEDMATQIERYRSTLEEEFKKGNFKSQLAKPRRYRRKPADWDSEEDGPWEDQPRALIQSDEDENSDDDSDGMTSVRAAPSTRGKTRGRGRGAAGATTTTRGRGRGGAAKGPALARATRKRTTQEESDEDDGDAMVIDDDSADSQALFVSEKKKSNGAARTTATRRGAATATTTTTTTTTARKPPPRAAAAKSKQSTLSFGASQASVSGNGRGKSAADDIEDDDDDDDEAFEPVSSVRPRKR